MLASGALPADDCHGAHARAARGGEAEALECAECGSTGKSKAAGSAGGWRRLALYALYAVVLWVMLLARRRSAALPASAAGADLPGREGAGRAGVTGLKGMLPRDSL